MTSLFFYMKRISLVFLLLNPIYNTYAFSVSNVRNVNKHFVGREETLKKIDALLSRNNIITIDGISGIGKSQVAERYIDLNRDKYDITWFIRASKHRLEDDIIGLAKSLHSHGIISNLSFIDKEVIIQRLLDTLGDTSKGWLLVLDDVESLDSVSKLLIHNKRGKGKIIITSTKVQKGPPLTLDALSDQDSFKLVDKILPDETQEDKKQLAQLLHNYPLAIVQAAHFIKSNPFVSIGDYKKEFTDNLGKLWSSKTEKDIIKSTKHTFDSYEKHVSATMLLNLHTVLDINKKFDDIVKFISILPSNQIYLEYLNQYVRRNNIDSSVLGSLLSQLMRYSLVNKDINSNKLYVMHDLTHKFLQVNYAQEDVKPYKSEFIRILNQQIPWNEMEAAIFFVKEPHRYSSLSKIVEEFKYLPVDDALLELMIKYSSYCGWAVKYSEQAEILNKLKAYEKQISKLKPESKVLYLVSKGFSNAFNSNDSTQALSDFGKALEIAKKAKNLARQKISIYNEMAQVYAYTGNIPEARKVIQEASPIINSTERLDLYSHYFYNYVLAKIHLEEGKYAEALKIISQSAEEAKKYLGDGDGNAYVITLLKAEILARKGDFNAALKLLDSQLSRIGVLVKDQDHWLRSKALALKAMVLSRNNNPKIAQKLIDESLQLLTLGKQIIKPDADLAFAYMVKGEIEKELGDYRQAMSFLKKAYESFQLINPDYKTDEVSSLIHSMIATYIKINDLVQASAWYKKHISLFGKNHHRNKNISMLFGDRPVE